MPHRSPRLFRLASRLAFAGTAAVVVLTAFNVAQPSLHARPGPGTVHDVPVQLTASPGPSPRQAPPGPAPQAAGGQRAPAPAQTPGQAPTTGAEVVSAPIAVGAARLVGISWPERAGAAPGGARHVLVRTRAGGRWSAWRELDADDGDGPDPGSAEDRSGRVYTDPLWLDAGTTDVQVGAEPAAPAAAGGVQAHLVAPDMTATPAAGAPAPGQAVGLASQPAIISRAQWGAVESLRRAAPEYSSTVKAAYVHHTVQGNGYSKAESAALVRADYVYHVRSRGWNDLGYNFLVDRYGQVFEGRYGGITRPVLGAHAAGFNTDTTGVALLGTFTSSRPPAATFGALQRLLAWKLDLTHVDPLGRTILTSRGGSTSRYPAGARVWAHTILGHRGTSYTTCPGDPVYALLPSIRAAVARIGLPKIYGGKASATTVDPGSGGSVTVRPRFSQNVAWRVAVVGANGSLVRAWTGTGTSAAVTWNGRTAGGVDAPAGWATVTVTARAGGSWARSVASRVFVRGPVPLGGATTGGFSGGRWTLSNYNADQLSTADFSRFTYGQTGDVPLVGDWNGDGAQTVGVARGNVFYLRNAASGHHDVPAFRFGRAGDRFLVGDWDGNGTWTPGVVRGGTWYLRNANTSGHANVKVTFGRAGDRFLAGDWDGNGSFTFAVRRGASFWGTNDPAGGGAQFGLTFGRATDRGVAGDWNGNGVWSFGLLRGGTRWFMKNSLDAGTAGLLGFGNQTPGTPVVGDWDNRP